MNTYIHRVEWGEADAAGIVFYPNYFRWFDQAAHELCRSIGYPVERMIEEGFAIPVLGTGANFRSPVFYDDELEIRSEVGEVRARAFRLDHQVSRSDETVGDGHEVRICARIASAGKHRLDTIPIPAGLRERLTPPTSKHPST